VSITVERVERHGRTPRDEDRARHPLALVAAAVVVVLVVGLVLLFGVVRPPVLAPLTDPRFDGAVAFTEWDREACVTVLEADGTREQVWCDEFGGELVAWAEEGLVVRTWPGDREELVTIDPASGEVLGSVGGHADEGYWREPEVRPGRARDGRLEVRHDGVVLWSTEADDRYEVTAGWLSPDGAWVALQDSAERLLVVPTDGSAPPSVWADDVEPYATLVWRGTPPTGS
jgi:hypothetical protein